jgi:membrane-associated HD superfamily phosphohydrolase
MNVLKNILAFITVVILLVSGINYLFINDLKNLKNSDNSIVVPEKSVEKKRNEKEKNSVKEEKNNKKIEKTKENNSDNTDLLSKNIELKCYKGQKIREILDEISKKYDIKFVYEKGAKLGTTDLGMDIENLSLNDALEILIADKGFIWYNKENESVRILRKLK